VIDDAEGYEACNGRKGTYEKITRLLYEEWRDFLQKIVHNVPLNYS
jgi:hypothetical protein